MQPSRNRLARNTDSRVRPDRRVPSRLRCVASLAALACSLGAGSAQAATGGASTAYGDARRRRGPRLQPLPQRRRQLVRPRPLRQQTACGQTLRPTTIGVAHRNLPCGTMVKFVYEGQAVIAPVIDRGPYVKGRAWDLTAAASEALELRRRRAWSATRSPSATPAPASPLSPTRPAVPAAPTANLPCSGRPFQREEHGHVEVFARSCRRGCAAEGSPAGAGAALAGSLAILAAARRRRRRRQVAQHDRSSSARPRPCRTPPARACPARRSAASPASRSATARPARPSCVPHDGTIKSWTLTLAQPTNSQRSFFNGFFGTPPQARLAILRRVPGTNPPRYNLRSQGSIKVLTPYLGQTVKFGASLKVEKGDIVGHHRPDLGPGLRPGPDRQQRLARQPRTRQMHQLHRRPPGRAAREARHAAPPTAASTPLRGCSTRSTLVED